MQRVEQFIRIRRTEHTDTGRIKKLIDQNTLEAFGKISVLKTVERSVLSLTLIKEENSVVGCACFSDAPSRKFTVPESWKHWFDKNIGLPNVDYINSLFIELLVVDPFYVTHSVDEVCKTVFTMLIDVQNIFLLTNSKADFKPASSKPFQKISSKSMTTDFSISVAYRHDVFPILFSRIAAVEDNDDLVPLFNSQTDLLRKTYGNYYIAELVEAQNEGLKCVVIECNRKAVGFVSATKRIDLENLNKCYDLILFNGLRKPHPKDNLSPSEESHEQENSLHLQGSYSSTEEQISSQIGETGTQKEVIAVDKVDGNFNWIRRPLVAEQNEKDYFSRKNIPVYYGDTDAFAIQLYAIKPGFESRFVDMLPFVFDQFPGINYAIISVPRLAPAFPMLRHFVRCRVRRGQDPEHELYVFHRAGLLRDFKVRRTRHDDRTQIVQLISHMHTYDQSLLLEDLQAYIEHGRDSDGSVITSFVAESMNKVIGLIIMRDEKDIEWLRAHYDIEAFIYYGHHALSEHATIYHCVLAVNYYCRRSVFLREVLRQANKTCLYYRVFPPYCPNEFYNRTTLNTCLSKFCIVRPRQQIVYPPKELLGEKMPEERVLVKQEVPPALFIGTARLFAEPKVHINARIIVVGASTTGLSFLMTLATCSYIRFTNLVLLSPNGMPGNTLNKPDDLASKFLSTDQCFSSEVLGQYALRHCVHVVRGKLTAIDRKFKFITVDENKRLNYDYLILTPGLQYHITCPLSEELSDNKKPYDIPFRPIRRMSMDYPLVRRPSNLFLLNDLPDATKVLNWICTAYLPTLSIEELNVPEWKKADKNRAKKQQELTNMNTGSDLTENIPSFSIDMNELAKDGNRLLVYGNNLDTYTCVAALLKAGVPGSRILMIQPPIYEGAKPAFEDDKVASLVQMQLNEREIPVLRAYTLSYWSSNQESDIEVIEEVAFTSVEQELKIKCKALFCLPEKTVDYDFFMATNNACLVYDARLVIDANFHTNDPAIRAAGPATKLQRIYYNDRWRHELANSREIGSLLGQQMLKLFDPSQTPLLKPLKDDCHLLPQFEEPKVVSALLPGDYHYLFVSKPALKELKEEMVNERNGGRILSTGGENTDKPYFSLHIDQYNKVQTIICLSKKPFPASNYIHLYDVHEKLLNKLLDRYDEGLISDFYSFLDDVWPLAIYHDRFAEFQSELREILHSIPPKGQQSIADNVREMLEGTGEIKPSEVEQLKAVYLNDGYKRTVEERLLNFISFNYNLLPMYAKPDLV